MFRPAFSQVENVGPTCFSGRTSRRGCSASPPHRAAATCVIKRARIARRDGAPRCTVRPPGRFFGPTGLCRPPSKGGRFSWQSAPVWGRLPSAGGRRPWWASRNLTEARPSLRGRAPRQVISRSLLVRLRLVNLALQNKRGKNPTKEAFAHQFSTGLSLSLSLLRCGNVGCRQRWFRARLLRHRGERK